MICDACNTICLPDPDHAPAHPPDGAMVYAWSDGRWVVYVQEEDDWLPW